MQTKKMPFLSFLLCCSITAAAQKPEGSPGENGIYLSDTDFLHHNLTFCFDNESQATRFKSPFTHNKELWIKTKDSTYKFSDDTIWGYRKKGSDFRIYRDDCYRVDYTENIFIYSIYSISGSGRGIIVFFSKTPEAPLRYLSKRRLLEVYRSDTAFVRKIKQMKWHDSIFKWNKQLNHYEFIDWLNKQPSDCNRKEPLGPAGI